MKTLLLLMLITLTSCQVIDTTFEVLDVLIPDDEPKKEITVDGVKYKEVDK